MPLHSFLLWPFSAFSIQARSVVLGHGLVKIWAQESILSAPEDAEGAFHWPAREGAGWEMCLGWERCMGGLGKGEGQGGDTIGLGHRATGHGVLCGWGTPGVVWILEVYFGGEG